MIIINKKNERFEVLLDKEDYEKVKDKYWHAAYRKDIDNYYIQNTQYQGRVDGKLKYKMTYLHRIIVDAPKGMDVDHKNRNPLDNRKDNLEIKFRKKNLVNRDKKGNSNNKSGYRNVCWNKNNNMWMVQMQVEGKNTKLGYFDDVHEAGKYAEKMRIVHYGHS